MNETFKLPKSFIHRIEKQFGEESQDFMASLSEKPTISLRLNPKKQNQQFADNPNVPWCKYGKYLEERPEFVFDPVIHAGGYYVQEPSSMLFPNAIDFNKNLKVLDLCAAPGGKSTLLLSFLNENSILYSNEIVNKRANILNENITKWGSANAVVLNNKTSDLKMFTGYFDVILVDAPCSGEGMFRKDPKTITQWSETKPFQCSVGQRNILDDAVQLLSHNGLLIYSTCTYSPEENEQIAQWFFSKYREILTPAKMQIDEKWGVEIEKINHSGNVPQEVYKCYPHKMKGEGMFVSVFKSTNNLHAHFSKKVKSLIKFKDLSKAEIETIQKYIELPRGYRLKQFDNKVYALPEQYLSEISLAFEKLNIIKAGVCIGTINQKTKEIIPTHELAMSEFLNKNISSIELNLENAIKYLRKEDINTDNQEFQEGWHIAKHQGLSLGWLKNTRNRFNNLYPMEWKIRKQYKPDEAF